VRASSLQNGHHAVQKTTTAGRPRKDASETGAPSSCVSWKSGACSPTDVPRAVVVVAAVVPPASVFTVLVGASASVGRLLDAHPVKEISPANITPPRMNALA